MLFYRKSPASNSPPTFLETKAFVILEKPHFLWWMTTYLLWSQVLHNNLKPLLIFMYHLFVFIILRYIWYVMFLCTYMQYSLVLWKPPSWYFPYSHLEMLTVPFRLGCTAERCKMGIIRSSFSFLLGTGCGIYVAQNYNVPNVKKLINTYIFVAKHIEETYRKPKKDED